VAISYTGTAPPAGSRLNFIVTAGNVPCEGTEASTTLYYVHADHLNTPRALVDAQNRVVWRWDSDPFGVTAPAEDPDGDGKAVTLDLRFPGQYFDRETNLHYNYFRDYDPQTGRYVQSDPIGLVGGLNTYAYAVLSPLRHVDPLGLLVETPPVQQPPIRPPITPPPGGVGGDGPDCVNVGTPSILYSTGGVAGFLRKVTVICSYFCPPDSFCPPNPGDYIYTITLYEVLQVAPWLNPCPPRLPRSAF
jgi:RHS repeat-associated protein